MTEGIRQLGIEPTLVVLTGDSAGGHLCTAVTTLCILRGFPRLPTALVLSYPALNTDLKRFYPAALLSFD
jgi:acetyl esterase/lipase